MSLPPADKPDDHYLEKCWNTLSLEMFRASSDPVMCAYMRLAFFMGANLAMGHYLRQVDKEGRRAVRLNLTKEIPTQIAEIGKYIKENKDK
jgi:hypothetical protein